MKKTVFQVRMAAALLATLGLMAGARSKAGSPASNQPKQMKEYQIELKDYSFEPKTLSVPLGAKVTWVNRDEAPHTVASSGHAFKSDVLDMNGRFSFVFDKAGTYEYFCTIHPYMTGKVVAQ